MPKVLMSGWIIPRRSPQARDVRTPKYRPRVVPDAKRKASKRACRNPRKSP
jgi:hypothetical protein